MLGWLENSFGFLKLEIDVGGALDSSLALMESFLAEDQIELRIVRSVIIKVIRVQLQRSDVEIFLEFMQMLHKFLIFFDLLLHDLHHIFSSFCIFLVSLYGQ